MCVNVVQCPAASLQMMWGRGFDGTSCPAPVSLCQRRSNRDLAESSGVTMLSTAVTISTMDPSNQDGEDTEASTLLNALQDGESPHYEDGPAPACRLLYFKPIAAIGVGSVLFGSGTALSLLYFTQVGNVPYLLGPLFLSVGLMFLVTGLVWIPLLKQNLEHKSLNHVEGLQVEHKHH